MTTRFDAPYPLIETVNPQHGHDHPGARIA